jgi:hypothetical protein
LRDVGASVLELRQRKLEELNIAVELDENRRVAGDGRSSPSCSRWC